jgi:hypothetical protein
LLDRQRDGEQTPGELVREEFQKICGANSKSSAVYATQKHVMKKTEGQAMQAITAH